MISKRKMKLIRSLELRKKRCEEGLFVGEGPKLVGDLLGVFPCVYLAATEEWWAQNEALRSSSLIEEKEVCTLDELQKTSFLMHPQEVIALFRIPAIPSTEASLPIYVHAIEQGLCLALDEVQDPGNLGTIIRLADWFGIEHIFCSLGCADVYNPKVVQATMGALARVQVHSLSLDELLQQLPSDTPVYGTFLDGEDMYTTTLSKNGLLLMGNEGNGISPSVAAKITHRLYIPSFPRNRETSESLNVAIATAVVCAEFRRRN